MDRQLTFPLITTIFKSIYSVLFLLLIVISITSFNVFFPTPSEQLTVLSNRDQDYQSQCPILSQTPSTPTQKKLPSTFTLLNWNIFKQQKENWSNSLKKWTNNADIITLQEAKLSPELIQLSIQQELFYLQTYAFKYNHFIYGVNTLSKVAPLSFCASTYKEPWILVSKAGLASTYPIQGSIDPLLLINLHGVNFTFSEQPLREQIIPYLALIKQHKGPVIFSGDFNTWSNARLATVEKSLIKSGFSEALFNDDKRLTVFSLPLDHIYFRGLKVIKTESLTTDASDHNPQRVMFTIE